MNYDEECDGYDDVIGRSVEDDHCISPSTAHFMYDRTSQQHEMAAFIPGDNIAEEDSEDEAYKRAIQPTESLHDIPSLNSMDEARLRSCLDAIHNVVGDSIPEKILIDSVIKNKFDFEKSLDYVLSSAASYETTDYKQQLGDATKEASGASRPRQRTSDRSGIKEAKISSDDVKITTEAFTKMSFPSTKPAVTGFFPQDTVLSGATKIEQQNGNKNALVEGNLEKYNNRSITEDAGQTSTPTIKSMPRSRDPSSKLDPEAEYQKHRGNCKQLLNLVVIGHVDAGKSTLMGHLLCLVGAVSQKIMHKYELESKKIGKASFMYAWVLDETGEERSRGVTMDVGYFKFETPNKAVTLLDAPGHKDFIPNMITGAAQADVALLVVDATRGEFETGFEAGGQTREHALLVRSLGVSQIAVAINKLDTVNWAEERYLEIVKTLTYFLVKQAGFKDEDVTCIPCSGLTGENLTSPPSEDALKKWYSGPTLLEQIDLFRSPDRPVTKPFRLCVSDVFKSQGNLFSVAGKVETGFTLAGDKVTVMPIGEQAIVKSIMVDDVSQTNAFAGDQVVVSLSGIDMANVTVGSVVCDSRHSIRASNRFQARIVVFNIEIPITKGFQAILHYQSLCEPVVLKKIVSQLHKSTGEAMKKKPRCLTKQNNAIVELLANRQICMEEYKDVRELGRFMLRSGGSTVAAGVITKIL